MWYRRRSIIFGLIFACGFMLAGLVAVITNTPYVPGFVVIGLHMAGETGINVTFTVALLFVLLCFIIRVWGSSYLQAALVWNADAKAEHLFVAGPFRYTRNPLYFGTMLMAIGIGSVGPPIAWAFIVIVSAVFTYFLIDHEEQLLRKRFSKAYHDYCSNVPRFWPRLRPAPQIGHITPSLREGLRAEAFSGAMFLAMCALLVGPPAGLYAFFVIYAAGIVAQRMLVRRGA